MVKIFVNYRRDDERSAAARLRDRLADVLGHLRRFDHGHLGRFLTREFFRLLAGQNHHPGVPGVI